MTRSNLFKSALMLATAVALFGCAGDDTPIQVPRGGSNTGGTPGTGNTSTIPSVAGFKYLIVAGDDEGNVNFFGDDGDMKVEAIKDPADATKPYMLSLMNSKGEHYAFGETVVADIASGEHLAFVLLRRHVLDATGAAVGGGIAVIDLEHLVVVGEIPLKSKSGQMSAPSHLYLSPDMATLWVTNDGPSDDPTTTAREDAGADSVFVLHVADMELMEDTAGKLMLDHYELEEYTLGDGPKVGAFSHHVTGHDEVHDWFLATNATDQTVHIVPMTAGADGMIMPTSLDLNVGLAAGSEKVNRPAGADFSPVSGKLYVGVESGKDVAVATIDAKTATGMDPALNVEMFKVGAAADMKIPAAGYVATSHDGDFVFTVGYVPGTADAPDSGRGYLSVIMADADMDMVTDVIDLGNLNPKSLLIHEDMATMNLKIFIPGADMTMADPANPGMQMEVPGLMNNKVAVVTVMHDTGMAMEHAAGVKVEYIDVPKGGAERMGQFTTDGEHVIFPAGNVRDCGSDHHPHAMMDMAPENGCMALSVIHVADNEVVATMQTHAHMPTGLAVWKIAAPTSAPGGSGSGTGSSGGGSGHGGSGGGGHMNM